MPAKEFASSAESLERRTLLHLPPTEIRDKPLDDDDLQLRAEYRSNLPGCDFVLTTHNGRPYFVPPWHRWFTLPAAAKAIHYAKVDIDGGSGRAVVNKQDPTKIDHANIVLSDRRMDRYKASWKALGYDVPFHEVEQSTFDLMMILGERILRTGEGIPSRAYLRQFGAISTIGVGVAGASTDKIFEGIYMNNMPSYFSEEATKRIYESKDEGLHATVFLEEQRLAPIKGKIAANYALAGGLSKVARETFNDDEAIILAPHAYDERTGGVIRVFASDGPEALNYMLRFQHFADGPGEGLIAVKKYANGTVEIWIPPKSVNQLDSTTMAYISHHMAPEMGYQVIERPFGFHEVRNGMVDTVIMVGNAVGAAPVKHYRVVLSEGSLVDEFSTSVSEEARAIRDEYSNRVEERKIIPGDPLLTHVDIHSPQAQKAREIMYNAWQRHF